MLKCPAGPKKRRCESYEKKVEIVPPISCASPTQEKGRTGLVWASIYSSFNTESRFEMKVSYFEGNDRIDSNVLSVCVCAGTWERERVRPAMLITADTTNNGPNPQSYLNGLKQCKNPWRLGVRHSCKFLPWVPNFPLFSIEAIEFTAIPFSHADCWSYAMCWCGELLLINRAFKTLSPCAWVWQRTRLCY